MSVNSFVNISKCEYTCIFFWCTDDDFPANVFFLRRRRWCDEKSLTLKHIYATMLNTLKSYPDCPVWVLRRWQTAARWRSWPPSCRCGWSRRAGCVLVERCRALLQCPPHVSEWSPAGRGKHKRVITINMTAKITLSSSFFFAFLVVVCMCVCVCSLPDCYVVNHRGLLPDRLLSSK